TTGSTRFRSPPMLAPAPVRHRNNLVHSRMPGWNLGKTFFDYPVDLCTRHVPGNVGYSRQHVYQVAQRRCANDEDFFRHAAIIKLTGQQQRGASIAWPYRSTLTACG